MVAPDVQPSKHRVYVRAYKTLIGELPHDTQVTPTLTFATFMGGPMSASAGSCDGVLIEINQPAEDH